MSSLSDKLNFIIKYDLALSPKMVLRKIAIIGEPKGLYTKILCSYLVKNNFIEFDIIAKKNRKEKKTIFYEFFKFINKIKNIYSEGKHRAIKWYHPFNLILILERLEARNNQIIKNIKNKYQILKLKETSKIHLVPKINSLETKKILINEKYDLVVLTDAPIIKSEILDNARLCINAHPAKLPECRGGGAIECTLLKKLPISVTIYKVTEGIDEGDIISISELKLKKSDNISTIKYRITELSAIKLSEFISNYSDDYNFQIINNSGKLNFWKDWTAEKQLMARFNLYIKKKKLK